MTWKISLYFECYLSFPMFAHPYISSFCCLSKHKSSTFDIETNFMLHENQLFWLFVENYSKRKHFTSRHYIHSSETAEDSTLIKE